ncbi:MAG TPA: hypothetical protein VJV78_21340, partial [Polyangiales bacterium]|nr:hypothetical protein [Polyangiales bacterium]
MRMKSGLKRFWLCSCLLALACSGAPRGPSAILGAGAGASTVSGAGAGATAAAGTVTATAGAGQGASA